MAQASEVAIPNASQLILNRIRGQKYNIATMLQNHIFVIRHPVLQFLWVAKQ
jgi:hypothetical protein